MTSAAGDLNPAMGPPCCVVLGKLVSLSLHGARHCVSSPFTAIDITTFYFGVTVFCTSIILLNTNPSWAGFWAMCYK